MPIVVRRKRGANDIALEVDHDGDGGFWTGFEDVSEDVGSLDLERGLSPAFGSVVGGAMTAELDNRANLYSPESPSSPIAGLLKPYKDFRVRVFTEAPATPNSGLSFDGNGGLAVGNLGASWSQPVWSVECWMKWNGSTAQPFRHVFGVGAGATHFLTAYIHTALSRFTFKTTIAGVVYDAIGILAITPGLWYHMALTYDGANLRAYVNGLLIETRAATGTVDNADDSIILASNADFQTSTAFDGVLDEFRLWKAPRTAQAIRDDMFIEIPGTHPDLVGYWRLNEASGGVAQDETPTNNDLTLVAHGTADLPIWVEGAGLKKDVEQTVMTGKVLRWKVHESEQNLRTAVLSGSDAFALLGAEVRLDTIQTTTTAALIASILDQAGLDSTKRIIDVGTGDAIPIAFGERRSAQAWLDAIALFGYTQHVDRLGRYVIRGRTGQAVQSNVGTVSLPEDLEVAADAEGLTTRVKVVAHPFLVSALDVIVWASGFLPFNLEPGEEKTISAVFQDQSTLRNEGVLTLVTPAATTDYLAEDLGAADRTANLSVTLVGGPSTSTDMKVKNNYSATLKVTKLQLRGKPVLPLNPEIVELTTGGPYPELFREIDSDMIQTKGMAETVAAYFATKYGAPRIHYALAWTDIERWDPVALAADVGNLITLAVEGGRVSTVQAQILGQRLRAEGRMLSFGLTLDRFAGVPHIPPLLDPWNHLL